MRWIYLLLLIILVICVAMYYTDGKLPSMLGAGEDDVLESYIEE